MTCIAVIVTFNPKPGQLSSLIRAIETSVSKILIVDNGSKIFKPTSSFSNKLDFITNELNMGVGYAYNQGIEYALKCNAQFLILFDQDSEPMDGLIDELSCTYLEQIAKGNKIAAIGPSYYESNLGCVSSFLKKGLFRMVSVDTIDAFTEVDHLISSGTMIHLTSLQEVGFFEDSLFVDYVDTEWCIRANVAGFKLLGCKNAFMNHTIGLEGVTFFNQKINMCEPIRVYYKARNATWLIRSKHVSFNWKIILVNLIIKLFIMNVVLASRKLDRVNFFIKGVYHGLLNQMGRYK
ncbi:MAG: glycosyltransferase family 2 protein [Gammaproteobacteria bacterium]|nr:MAG: glycosyltransferase family 2 protein [Gammaproteobacteria bacterium]